MEKLVRIIEAIGNSFLIASVVVLVSACMNSFCIWSGFFGLLLTFVILISGLWGSWELFLARGHSYLFATVFCSVFAYYLFSVTVQGWFLSAAVCALLMIGFVLHYNESDISLTAICCTGYVFGVEVSFVWMGDIIPENEMKIEYLAGGTLVLLTLIYCVQRACKNIWA